MQKIVFTESMGIPHSTFEEEFLSHKKCSEWWYATGYLNDNDGKMYGFQYTLARVKIFGIRFHMLLTSVTDFQTAKHYYGQRMVLFGKNVVTTEKTTALGDKAIIKFSPNPFNSKGHMELSMRANEYDLNITMDATKAPVWHCEDGKLIMGVLDDPKQTTYYYSYTNLATKGTLMLNGKKLDVTGKSWFDKQGGTYSLTKREVNWEWFSFRFFDNEEIMLFSFPQDNYSDGTYIHRDGKYERLNKYEITPMGFTQASGYKFSNGWKVKIPGIKDEEYTITPKIAGQFNVFFFELLAEIKNKENKLVGYCFVELLPGVYNEKLQSSRAFKKVD